jgi:hypothetical protein
LSIQQQDLEVNLLYQGMATQEGSEDVQILIDVQLLQQVLPIFSQFLESCPFSTHWNSTAKIIAYQMITFKRQLASINTLIPSELQLAGLQTYPFPQSTADMLQELNGWLNDDVTSRPELATLGQRKVRSYICTVRYLLMLSRQAILD